MMQIMQFPCHSFCVSREQIMDWATHVHLGLLWTSANALLCLTDIKGWEELLLFRTGS